MLRKFFFWLHLATGVTAGLLILVMAATGVVLSFERQITDFVDRDLRSVTVPNEARPRPTNDLLEAVRRASVGTPTAITVRNRPGATTQFSIGRTRTIYVDSYSGAILGPSSIAAHDFFFRVERLHRALGAPAGSKSFGSWLAAIANLLFLALILLGVVLWLPRKPGWKSLRPSIAFRGRLRGRARDWNWHNVVGIWCALPLLVIVLTGVVMSFGWANILLFRLAGSPTPIARRDGGDQRPPNRNMKGGSEPNYDFLFTATKSFRPDWRTITLNIANGRGGPVSATLDTGTPGQPQKRTSYLLNPNTAAVMKITSFADGSLGQRLRTFVRFGHTGEYGGWAGQAIAGIASFGACVLVYTGLSLTIRRLTASLRRRHVTVSPQKYEAEPVA